MRSVTQKTPAIRPAVLSDVRELSQLRLEALQNEPDAFSRDYQTDSNNSLGDWEKWLRQRNDETMGIIFVAYVDHQLAGMMGIVRGLTTKTQHNGTIWGVYVRPDYRRQGIGGGLMAACVGWARQRGVEVVKLGVTSTNVAAIRLYAASGFQVYGMEPKALRYDGRYYDELLMLRELNNESPPRVTPGVGVSGT
jgi:ribosomal protein S18 acetylase RimI-like enzyme